VIRDLPTGWYSTALTSLGVQEELVLNECPKAGPDEHLFVIETALAGPRLPRYPKPIRADGFVLGGYRLGTATAVDASGRVIPCIVSLLERSLLICVPMTWLQSAQYPVVIDPDFSSDSAGGYVWGQSGTWSTARSTAYSFSTGASTFISGADNDAGSYHVYRGFLKFNTQSLTSAARITTVYVYLASPSHMGTGWTLYVNEVDWSGQDPLSGGNIDTAYDANLAAPYYLWHSHTGLASNTYYAATCSNTWPRPYSYTYYGMIGNMDVGDAAPGTNSWYYATLHSAGSGYPPVLSVGYTLLNNRTRLGVGF
jgi:hypothetical protein